MEKQDLIQLLSEIFVPLGFKKKGNNWVTNGDELSKVVNLQKSNYSDAFYINYSFIIKTIELTTRTHVPHRLGSLDKSEERLITELLDLENNMDSLKRIGLLRKFINAQIVVLMQRVNNEAELLQYLKSRPHLYNVTPDVKLHFGLPLD